MQNMETFFLSAIICRQKEGPMFALYQSVTCFDKY